MKIDNKIETFYFPYEIIVVNMNCSDQMNILEVQTSQWEAD